MATLIGAAPPASAPEASTPRRRLLAWLSDPRRALLAAVLILTGGVDAPMAEGILRAARGQVPANVVNPDVLQRAGFQAKLARFAANA